MSDDNKAYAAVPVGGWLVTFDDDSKPQLRLKQGDQVDVRWVWFTGELVPEEDREIERGSFNRGVRIYPVSAETAEACIMLAHHKPTEDAWDRFVKRQVT